MAISLEAKAKPYTVDDLLAIPDDPQHDRRFELIDGEIIEMGTSSQKHSTLGAWLLVRLGIFVETQQIGGRFHGADGTYRLDAANVRVPDVSYLTPASVAKLPVGTVFCPFAPDFVIEIKSPSDSTPKMRRLALLYIKAGAQLIWVIDPEDKLARVYRPNQAALELGENESLDGFDVLPGFKISLNTMFAQIENL